LALGSGWAPRPLGTTARPPARSLPAARHGAAGLPATRPAGGTLSGRGRL